MFVTFPRGQRTSMQGALNLDRDVQITHETPGGFLRGKLTLGKPNEAGVFTVILLQKGQHSAVRVNVTIIAEDLRRALATGWTVTALCIHQSGACLTVRDLVLIHPTLTDVRFNRDHFEREYGSASEDVLTACYWKPLDVLERELAKHG